MTIEFAVKLLVDNLSSCQNNILKTLFASLCLQEEKKKNCRY